MTACGAEKKIAISFTIWVLFQRQFQKEIFFMCSVLLLNFLLLNSKIYPKVDHGLMRHFEAFCTSKNLTSSIKLNFISMFNKQKENMKMKKVKRYLQDAAAYHAKF